MAATAFFGSNQGMPCGSAIIAVPACAPAIGVGTATVRVINASVTPAIDITDTTNVSGSLQLVGIPTSTQGYRITVTKSGYSSERTYATMERAVEELFVRGEVTSTPEAIALIDSITADDVRAVFERMLQRPPALAITGKAASGKAARQLADLLVDATQ